MTRSRRISHTPSTHRPSCRSCIFIRSTELCSVCRKTTAWNTRDARWSMVIAGISADPKQADALKTWGRAYWKAIHPFNLEGGYVNFLMDDEVQGGESRPRTATTTSVLRESQVRSREPVSREPEHPAGRRLTAARTQMFECVRIAAQTPAIRSHSGDAQPESALAWATVIRVTHEAERCPLTGSVSERFYASRRAPCPAVTAPRPARASVVARVRKPTALPVRTARTPSPGRTP